MIHGQLGSRRSATTVMAVAFGAAPFPPLGLSQIPGFPALPLKISIIQIISIWPQGVSPAAVSVEG